MPTPVGIEIKYAGPEANDRKVRQLLWRIGERAHKAKAAI